MTPKAVPSVQSTTDVVLLEAPASKSTILPLTPPSDNVTTSNEDNLVSRTGQERPADSSPTLTENQSLVTQEVAVRDPIVFVDPLGSLWTLPFEKAKTWEGLTTNLKNIFDTDLFDGYYPRLRSAWDDGKVSLSIVRIPQELNISPNLWAQLVEPGWRIKIQFRAKSTDMNDGDIKDAPQKVVEGLHLNSDQGKGDEEAGIVQDIIYVANLYQQDGSRYPDFLGHKTFKGAVLNHVQPKSDTTNTVLCELRNVYISQNKRTSEKPTDSTLIDTDDLLGVCTLEVHSKPLLHALNAVLQFHTPEEEEDEHGFRLNKENFTDLQRGRFKFPYLDLYHHIDELVAYKSKVDGSRQCHSEEYNKECDHHIDTLIKYLNDQPTVAFSNAKVAWSQKVPVTTFNWLWLLLKPGADVYVRERGCLNAYVIEYVDGFTRYSTSRPRPIRVKVWNLDYDGKVFGRSSKIIIVPTFDGEREIQSLPIFPTCFHQDKEGDLPLLETLIQRGKKFVKVLNQPTYREYTGPSSFFSAKTYDRARVVVDHTSRSWEYDTLLSHVNTHVPRVDDDYTLGQHIRAATCPCSTCTEVNGRSEALYRRVIFDDYDELSLESEQSLTDHQYSLCFSHVYAYALQDKHWDLVDVQWICDPRIDERVIDTLVMKPESNKTMIKAICETYTTKVDRDNSFYVDYIKGKGEGQIVLLHGPPGTGKTLTAESVAEYTRRPLLSITAADLGQEPDRLEQNLLRFFRDASKWDAIVLLDEADVYLERRSSNELRRNSIVSIFLRQLEYFQGVLFMTTNRVGSFDEAFMSRIHIQIAFDPLDEEARQQIWMNSFAKLEANTEHGGREMLVAYSAKEFVKESKKLRSLNWNGREIRNAFQTAVTLASFEARQKGKIVPKVTEGHFAQIVDMSSAFKKYMHSTLGDNDAQNAYRARLRDDTFKLVPVSGLNRDA